jgi:hypothetical protein
LAFRTFGTGSSVPPWWSLVLLVVYSVCASSGCARVRGVSRCRTLAETVNQTLDAVEAATSVPKPGAEAYRTASTHYAALEKELEGFDPERAELKEPLTELTDVIRGAKEQSGVLSDAIASGNKGSRQVSERELERLSRRQKAVAQRIDKACRGH